MAPNDPVSRETPRAPGRRPRSSVAAATGDECIGGHQGEGGCGTKRGPRDGGINCDRACPPIASRNTQPGVARREFVSRELVKRELVSAARWSPRPIGRDVSREALAARGNRVYAAEVPGVTAQDSPGNQPRPAEHAMPANGRHCVCRAGRVESAPRRDERADEAAVRINRRQGPGNRDALQGPAHGINGFALALPMPSTRVRPVGQPATRSLLARWPRQGRAWRSTRSRCLRSRLRIAGMPRVVVA